MCCSYTFACSQEFDRLQTEVYDRVSKENARRRETLQQATDIKNDEPQSEKTPLAISVKPTSRSRIQIY